MTTITNGEKTKSAFHTFWSNYIVGVVFLITGIILAIILLFIAEYFNEEGLTYKILIKLAEASMFIGGVGLIGTVYVFLNSFRNMSFENNDFESINEAFCKNIGTLKKKVIYEIS